MRKVWILPLLTLLTLPAHAANIKQQLTLPDGKEVVLYDDFTWSYRIIEKPQTASGQASTPASEQLTAQAKQDQGLLGTVAAQGVKVELLDKQIRGQSLELQVQVSNLAAGSVVNVRGVATLYTPEGKEIGKYPVSFWQAEYRLPESYLREGQVRQPEQPLKLQLAAGNALPLIRLQILEVERRS